MCSCSLPHPTTPCAVSIAGWSWYNCTCFKHALKLHSLYFPSPQRVHSYAEKEKRRAHCVQPAMLFTNHSGFPTLPVSLPPSFFSSLPPSLCTPTKEKKKKSAGKKKCQAASSFWVLLSIALLLNRCECVCVCVGRSLSCHISNTLQQRRPEQKAKRSRARGGETQG